MVTRIRQLLDWQQLSPTQFADLIGVGRPVVSHILSERNKPSLEVVQRVIAAFPTVSLPWLLSGTGEMLAAASSGSPATPALVESPAPASTPNTLGLTPPKVAVPTTAPVFAPMAPVPPAEHRLAASIIPPIPAPTRFVVNKAAASPAKAPAVLLVEPALPPTPPETVLPQADPAFPLQPAAPSAQLPPSPAPSVFPASETEPLVAPTALLPANAPLAAPPVAPNATAPAEPPVSVPPAPEAAFLPFLGEPGKAIRRIVIFYRDGSFADYQPEE